MSDTDDHPVAGRRPPKHRPLMAPLFAIVWCAASTHAAFVPAQVVPEDTGRNVEIRRFADKFFEEQMASLDIPGAVFVVVDRGDTALAVGYGVATRETAAPVDPEITRFRVGSVGKTFTALAVLQLVESGALDLDGNVNELLDSPIEEAGLGPITLHQLLTHTAGFEERLIGYFARPGRPESLTDHLARRMPRRSFRPDDISRYSNHGYALAGLVVERMSGRPFRIHAQEAIFRPLGMTRTDYMTLPLPDWTDGLATEYWASGEIAELRVSNPYPAGSLATTGADMRRFLEALVVRSDEAAPEVVRRVLGADSRRWMQTVQFSHNPHLAGFTYGMNRTRIHGREVVVKSGSGQCHAAILGFLPDSEIGFFGAINRQEPQVWTRLLPRFVQLFSQSPPSGEPARQSETSVATRQVRGEYRLGRYAESSIERLLSLAVHATVKADGRDVVSVVVPVASSLDGDFRHVSGAVFRNEDGDRSIAFRVDGGRATHLFMDFSGEPLAFERVSRSERVAPVLTALAAVVIVLLSGSVAAAARGLASLVRRSKRASLPRPQRLASLVGTVTGVWGLATLIALVLAVARWKEWPQAAPDELIVAAALATGVPFLALALTVATGMAWRRSYWGLVRRLHFTAVALAAVVLTLLLIRYHVWLGQL